jgi:ABC-2 type transport system permease protein
MIAIYWTAFQTIVRKEVMRFLRIWVQTLIPPMITMTLYFLIFGELIGKRIGPMEGVSYMEFIAPGLIMMSVITNAYSNTVSSFYSAKFQGNLEEIMVAPVPHHVVIIGFMVGGICRGVLSGCLVAGVASYFISFQFEHLGVAFLVLILTATLFAIAGILNALFANSFDEISIIPTFVLTPLTYLGGVFFPVNLLPDFWHMIASLNPIVYMVSAFRYGFLGFTSIDIMVSLELIFVCVLVFYFMTYLLFKKGVGMRS